MNRRMDSVASRHLRGSGNWRSIACLCGLLLLLTGLSCNNGGDDDDSGSSSGGSEVEDLGEGLELTILSAEVGADRRVVVEFTLADGEGTPADLAQLDGNPSFLIAWITVDPENGYTRYQSYLLRNVAGQNFNYNGMTMPPLLESADQAVTDSGGTFVTLGAGSHLYTFGTALPEDFDAAATHSVGAYATREGRAYVANDVFTFVPAGGPPPVTREVVREEDCNECHGELALHGGTRRKIALCVLCHTDQTVDPETGENLALGPMVHKIHQGENLTNLPYFIVGFRQSVNDYSGVGFPQDVRNCTTCHREEEPEAPEIEAPAIASSEGAAADASNWRFMPSRAHCGACHDDVNFLTGENHSDGIQQFDDTLCARCHREVQIVEFDRTVPGAHVVPYESSLNPQLTLEITDVQNMTPSSQPTVSFTVSDASGPVDISTLDRVSAIFVGPTTDYVGPRTSMNINSTTGTVVVNAIGDYTYTPTAYTIPDDATGSWSVGLEGRTQQIQAGPESIRFGANNPVAHVDVSVGSLGGGSPEPRREVVDLANCNVCHQRLRFHGNTRSEIESCVLCHNPWFTDGDGQDTVDFKVLIHKIHRGEDLTKPYRDFNDIVFPGFLNDCSNCHVNDSQLFPFPAGTKATVINVDRVPVDRPDAIRPPVTSSCTSCHDTDAAITHAAVNSIVVDPLTTFESCEVCHKESGLAPVSEVHAR